MLIKIHNYKVIGICLVLQYLQNANAACHEGQFQCNNGECLSADVKCNTKLDCRDGSDETFEHCYQSKCSSYRCSYGACLDESKFCDGKKDCWDGTDEVQLNCANNTHLDELYKNEIRGECIHEAYTQFQCRRSKECISYNRVCDGVEDCKDQSDESSNLCVASICPEESFRCAYGACIAKTAVCNEKYDCRDESDELESICKSWPNISSEANTNTHTHINTDTPNISIPPDRRKKSCTVPTNDTALVIGTAYSGMRIMKVDVSHQMTVRYRCDPQHVLEGTDMNTCDNGKWLAPWPKCVKVCDSRRITIDTRINALCRYQGEIFDCSKEPTILNTTVEVKCGQGYIHQDDVKEDSLFCDSDGHWKRSDPKSPVLKCEIDCGKTFGTVKEDPWLVSIYHNTSNSSFSFSCLGAIIDPFNVMTTAKCFPANSISHKFLVVLGNNTIGFNLEEEHGFDISYINSIYNFGSLSMITTVSPFVLSAKVRPICLRSFPDDISKNEEPVESWRALGEPLVYFDPELHRYFLTNIVVNHKRMGYYYETKTL
ncbi:modular serine protease-like [Drosophila innubila]|uniref:modular serine protease-like n=1 Tax=Drosophila innubila TaxID=198719 RepID=UPI00148B9529|nr:modular serine protease-like [Drosophila innubila]